jgi:hypothetical protein
MRMARRNAKILLNTPLVAIFYRNSILLELNFVKVYQVQKILTQWNLREKSVSTSMTYRFPVTVYCFWLSLDLSGQSLYLIYNGNHTVYIIVIFRISQWGQRENCTLWRYKQSCPLRQVINQICFLYYSKLCVFQAPWVFFRIWKGTNLMF